LTSAQCLLLAKKDLSAFLDMAAGNMQVVAPCQNEQGDVNYITWVQGEDADIALLPGPVYGSLKQFLLPQTGCLFCYNSDGGDTTIEVTDRSQRVMLFGLRPCDVKAIRLLDKIHAEDFRDDYYFNARENMLLVSVACNKVPETCFCTSMGGSPHGDGADLMFIDLGDEYLIRPGSDAGSKLLSGSDLFSPAQDEHIEQAQKLAQEAEVAVQKQIDVAAVLENPAVESEAEDKFWQDLAKRCLRCGTCSFNCPLCYCFNIVDRGDEKEGKRIRLWDSCQLAGFTRLAGGENPTKSDAARAVRYFNHKMKEMPEKYGEYGCVGCGRCAVGCYGNIDMASVLEKLAGGEEWA